jgi:O-6-methylguanine DNA methyltransferase
MFKNKVLAAVKKIPDGRTLTYKQVAALAGSPKVSRAVGNILHTNFDPEIPCHRVVRSDGKTGGYNRGRALKKKLLSAEKKEAAVKNIRLA